MQMFNNVDFDSIDITQEPPEEEPARQYYFIAKCRKYVKEQSERLGRPLFSVVRTFGCQMNAKDSEKLAGVLKQIGFCEGTDRKSVV